MNWYEYLVLTPVRAANEVRSNVWSVILISIGIMLVLHGHENVGGSLVTGAFAVFRSSNTETAPASAPPPVSAAAVTDPNVK
jgi:hypothetical protein